MTDLTARLRADLTQAMRDRDRDTARVLRTVLSAIANAEAQPAVDPTPGADGPIAGAAVGVGATEARRRELTDDDVRAVVLAERDERVAAADDLASRGATEAAQALHAEALLLDRYLN